LFAASIAIAIFVVAMVAAASRQFMSSAGPPDKTAPKPRAPLGISVFLGALAFIAFFAEGAVLDWSAVMLTELHHWSRDTAGTAYALFSVSIAAGRFAGDQVVNTLGPSATFIMGAMLGAAGFGLSLAPQDGLVLLGFVLAGLGVANMAPVVFSRSGSGPGKAGASVVVVIFLGYVGLVSGPAAVGFLADHVGLGPAMLIVPVLLLCAAAAFTALPMMSSPERQP
jgi:fucose permease